MPPEDDYEVGYKKPPKATRFQEGRSGNPKGRIKGALNVSTALMAALNERVTIRENGQQRSITKLDAMVKQIVNKAASGDIRAMKEVVGLIASQIIPQDESPLGQVLEPADVAIGQHLLQRLRRQIVAEVDAQPIAADTGSISSGVNHDES